MRLEVDQDLCQGNAVCTRQFPQYFDFDEATQQAVLLVEDMPSEDGRRALAGCPVGAISLISL
jgi:ferredoxin